MAKPLFVGRAPRCGVVNIPSSASSETDSSSVTVVEVLDFTAPSKPRVGHRLSLPSASTGRYQARKAVGVSQSTSAAQIRPVVSSSELSNNRSIHEASTVFVRSRTRCHSDRPSIAYGDLADGDFGVAGSASRVTFTNDSLNLDAEDGPLIVHVVPSKSLNCMSQCHAEEVAAAQAALEESRNARLSRSGKLSQSLKKSVKRSIRTFSEVFY